MAALEDERLFLVAHAMLTETSAGEEASDNPQHELWRSLVETAEGSGHWKVTYDGVNIELVEDRPGRDAGSWCDEIWAVATAPGLTPGQRAEVRRRWHERLDVPLWTARYSRIALWAVALPAATFAARRRRPRPSRPATRQRPLPGLRLRPARLPHPAAPNAGEPPTFIMRSNCECPALSQPVAGVAIGSFDSLTSRFDETSPRIGMYNVG